MKQLITTKEGNKLIAEFMGIKWQPASHMSSSHLRTYEPIYETYEECLSVCKKENSILGGSPREIEHLRPVPVINSIKRELKYHTSWNWIMDVVEKIKKMELPEFGKKKPVMNALMDVEIKVLWPSVVDFIQWYNQNKTQCQ